MAGQIIQRGERTWLVRLYVGRVQGKRKYDGLRYLEGSEEPEAQAVIKLYRKMAKYWVRHVPLEAYAVAAKISPTKLFGLIAEEMMDEGQKTIELLTRASHPEVVQKTIQMALKPSGVSEMIHRAIGFLPTPKNSCTVVNNRAHIDARSTANVAVLPPMEMFSRQLMECFREIPPPQLPVPAEMAPTKTALRLSNYPRHARHADLKGFG